MNRALLLLALTMPCAGCASFGLVADNMHRAVEASMPVGGPPPTVPPLPKGAPRPEPRP